jgi:hypothetical protein
MDDRSRTTNRQGSNGPQPRPGGASAFVRPEAATDRERARQQQLRAEQERMRAEAEQLRYLIDLAIVAAAGDRPRVADEHVMTLIAHSSAAIEDWQDPAYVIGEEVLTMVGNRWEQGWQPDDVLHYLGRTTPRLDDLGRAAIREQVRRAGLQDKAPESWQRQLAGLDDAPRPGRGRHGWLFPSDLDPIRPWERALSLLDRLRRMHRLAPIGPPPSQWGEQRRTSSRPSAPAGFTAGAHDPELLSRVRALLAKAESTNFSAEAEALTAKAQELITRHAIDDALLQADSGQGTYYAISARRLYVDNPYAVTKATLAHCVAQPNRVRSVWDEHAGSCTLVGLATDLEQVELLFTSLLVQATRAMTEEAHGTRTGAVNRSAGFRRAFLLAYANRIGERLSETAEQVAAEYGKDALPVLSRQQDAVDEEFARMFPSITKGRTRRVNAHGWRAGTAAADQAVLPKGRLPAE